MEGKKQFSFEKCEKAISAVYCYWLWPMEGRPQVQTELKADSE